MSAMHYTCTILAPYLHYTCTILALYSHYTSIYLHFTFLTDFGQPDNSWGNEHCVAMQEEYDFYWNDVPCGSSSYKSLCEIKHQ